MAFVEQSLRSQRALQLLDRQRERTDAAGIETVDIQLVATLLLVHLHRTMGHHGHAVLRFEGNAQHVAAKADAGECSVAILQREVDVS